MKAFFHAVKAFWMLREPFPKLCKPFSSIGRFSKEITGHRKRRRGSTSSTCDAGKLAEGGHLRVRQLRVREIDVIQFAQRHELRETLPRHRRGAQAERVELRAGDLPHHRDLQPVARAQIGTGVGDEEAVLLEESRPSRRRGRQRS